MPSRLVPPPEDTAYRRRMESTTTALADRPEATAGDIAELLLEGRISAVPVVADDGRVCGIVSEGDLINRADAGTRHRRSWWLEAFKGPEDRARDFLRTDIIFFGLIVYAALGLITDAIVRALERYTTRYQNR